MTDLREPEYIDVVTEYGDYHPDGLMQINKTFTRSDGTIVARLYERLTKASRRTADADWCEPYGALSVSHQAAYRKGVYDAFKALQDELSS